MLILFLGIYILEIKLLEFNIYVRVCTVIWFVGVKVEYMNINVYIKNKNKKI